jgi:hypothetical protein
MDINFLALLIAAITPILIGFIWYNPRVFGNIWMIEAGLNKETMKPFNVAKVFLLSFVYAFLISFVLQMLVIHQFGAIGMVGGDPSIAKPSYAAFMADYGTAFRSFKHGALHGCMTGLFMILPVTGTGALYEQRSFRYVLVSSGFWIVSFTIMGGIICMMQ